VGPPKKVHGREQGKSTMLGAIAGDIIGSVYEARPIKTTRFPLFHPLCRFTDDTVLTVALADSLLHGAPFVGLLRMPCGRRFLWVGTATRWPALRGRLHRRFSGVCPR
jgi:ADP-ribosylglycohydrolase